jgi:hypothetical protein
MPIGDSRLFVSSVSAGIVLAIVAANGLFPLVGPAMGSAQQQTLSLLQDPGSPKIEPDSHQSKLPPPPASWKEHWFEHNQLVKLVASNEDLAIYFDDDMPRQGIAWIVPFVTKAWRYTKKTYGDFGPDPRLFVVVHQGKYGGGHPSTYFDESHDFRNVADCGLASWDRASIDMVSHEIGHIVETASNGVHESPAFVLWWDS